MIGETVGHYEIVQELGAGGMGTVYRARDLKLKRSVALKILPPELSANEDSLERFQREAEALAALSHPNIVTIHSVEADGGTHFLTMELVEGTPLSRSLPSGGLELDRLLELSIPVADALASAHGRGIVHRDVKPANVMVSDAGAVKVLDFGIAKLVDAEQAADAESPTRLATKPETMVGTVPYMSPEQIGGGQLDGRSDVFSFGVMLYEMALGHRPFQGDDVASTVAAIVRDDPPPVDQLRGELPHHLARVVGRCLEKAPDRRYQSMLDVRNELSGLREELQDPQVSGAVTRDPGVVVEVSEPAAVPTKARSRWLAPGVAAVALLAALGIWWVRSEAPSEGTQGETPARSGLSDSSEPSIAVLAFEDMSPEGDQEYLADGLAVELLSLLTNVKGLKVAARTSSFAFEDQDVHISTIGERLNVANVLEGTVRKSGDRVRVTAQLVDVADGFQRWSETYDRELDDIFAIQDEIAGAVARALEVSLLGGDEGRAGARGTDVEVYNLYLQGQHLAERRESAEDFERAIGFFRRALVVQPDYLPALVGLSYALVNQASQGWVEIGAVRDEALAAVQEALLMDESMADAWAVLGELRMELDGDWSGAAEALEEAARLEPENPDVLRKQAELAMTLGDLEPAIALSERAVELDPLSSLASGILWINYWAAGRLEDAQAASDRVLELGLIDEPDHYGTGLLALTQGEPELARTSFEQVEGPLRDFCLSMAHHDLGNVEASREARERFMAAIEAGEQPAPNVFLPRLFAYRGEIDQAFELLGRLDNPGDYSLVKAHPLLRNLHGDPRWQQTLERMDLAD